MQIREEVHIIDDDPSMRSALANLVDAAGLQARAYGSVSSFLEERPFDMAGCLLLDVRLPDVNGLEFQEQMAELGLYLPVVFITGHGDVRMTVKGMKAGAIDFLTKPFRDHEVLEAVSRALVFDRERRHAETSRLEIAQRFGQLTRRERQVMALVTTGMMNKQIAGELGIQEITVKVHRGVLMRKLGVRTLADLVKLSEHIALSSPDLMADTAQ